jgi:hypothetical protein
MDNPTGSYDPNKLTLDSLVLLTRGYFIPLVGAVIIILVIIFIYFPNVTGISADIQTIQQSNDHYTQVKDRIEYFKTLTSSTNEIALTDNVSAVDTVLPDQAKSADVVNQVDTLATSDGITIINNNSELQPLSNYSYFQGLSDNVTVIQIEFHGTGNSVQIRKLFDDISSANPISFVTNVNINGPINQNSSDDFTFELNVFSMDSNTIVKNINLLQAVNTAYQVSYINTL